MSPADLPLRLTKRKPLDMRPERSLRRTCVSTTSTGWLFLKALPIPKQFANRLARTLSFDEISNTGETRLSKEKGNLRLQAKWIILDETGDDLLFAPGKQRETQRIEERYDVLPSYEAVIEELHDYHRVHGVRWGHGLQVGDTNQF
ncbi:hypothetical protein NEOLI_004476 [Neolecta irregularis DAH-3]|uniref:Uncharacterized protein n=1 Tax=Neolecta irregularis (strain DAH-3) TaxID=1198029 RepID=A0A1U7LMI6_NEOID|nr:hypothetical protein NEOLI_004476 [Neolecta irregularis DAH-3]|eukprot:OLL23880.1 hypothetical protein NEOLI_004476 [Neolecta irregularis DAH-3]